MVYKRLNFAVLAVVANAYHRGFRFFDYFDKCCNAAAVTCPDPINLVHNDHSLLGRKSTDSSSNSVLVVTFFEPTSNREVIERLVGRKVFDRCF